MAAAAVLVWVVWPGPNLREGSIELPSGTAVRLAARTPASYRIVYRVETHAAGAMVVDTDDVVVRRPFEGRSQTRTGPPPGASPRGETVNAFARLRADRVALAVPPGPASLDHRPSSFLPEAVRAGYAQPREARRVAGRPCRVYRLATASGSPGLLRVRNVKRTYTDRCVDDAGLVLEEVGVTDGKLSSRRLAVRVDEHPVIDGRWFEVGAPSLDVRHGGGSVRRMRPTSRPPGTFWEPARGPFGFRLMGRYAVIPPQTGFDDPTQRGRVIAFTSDVWVAGPDVIVLEQGATLQGALPFADDPNAVDVNAGKIGRGQLVYGLDQTEVRVRRAAGGFIRVTGTVAPSKLLEVARSLEGRKGGKLEFLE